MEIFKRVVLITLGLKGLGTNLLVATAVTALDGTKTSQGRVTATTFPLLTINREVADMTQCRAQHVGTNQHTCGIHVAICTGEVQLATLGIEMLLATVIHFQGTFVVRND